MNPGRAMTRWLAFAAAASVLLPLAGCRSSEEKSDNKTYYEGKNFRRPGSGPTGKRDQG